MEVNLEQKTNHELLRSGYWSVLFNGAKKLEIEDLELSSILKINYKTINHWHNNKAEQLPFHDLTYGDGVFVKQFMDLYISLRSMYVDSNSPCKWLRTPNPIFKNQTPIDFMSSEEMGIFFVNNYLKSMASV